MICLRLVIGLKCFCLLCLLFGFDKCCWVVLRLRLVCTGNCFWDSWGVLHVTDCCLVWCLRLLYRLVLYTCLKLGWLVGVLICRRQIERSFVVVDCGIWMLCFLVLCLFECLFFCEFATVFCGTWLDELRLFADDCYWFGLTCLLLC